MNILQRSEPHRKNLKTCLVVAFLLLSPVLCSGADDNSFNPMHALEYNVARDNASSGDIVQIDGTPAVAERAYVPEDPKLSHFKSQMGQGVRFVRVPGMGDDDFNKFVAAYTALLDEEMVRSKSFAKRIVEMSNAGNQIDWRRFKQGDRTVLAIMPRDHFLVEDAGGYQVKATPNVHTNSAEELNFLGLRRGSVVNAERGISSPSVLYLDRQVVEKFYAVKKILVANGYKFKRLSVTQINDFYKGLKYMAHEVSHASAALEGLMHNYQAAFDDLLARHLDPDDRKTAVKLLAYFEEMENSGFAHTVGRSLNENLINQELIDSGLGKVKGLKGVKVPFELTTKYGGLTPLQIINHITGVEPAPKWSALGKIKVSGKMAKAMRHTLEKWDDSMVRSLIDTRQAIDKRGAHVILLKLRGGGFEADLDRCHIDI